MPSQYKGSKVGFPIRRSLDQSLFAAPQGLSQRTTSFIASQRQGIHQMLLRHLIALMIHVRRFRDSMCFSPCTLGRGAQAIRKTCSRLSPGTYLLAKWTRPMRPCGAAAGGQLETLPTGSIPSLRFQTPAGRPTRSRACVSLAPAGFSRTAPQISLTVRTAQHRQAPWWSQTGSNRRPHACKACALPTELWPLQDWPQAPAATFVALASRAIRRGGRSALPRPLRASVA